MSDHQDRQDDPGQNVIRRVEDRLLQSLSSAPATFLLTPEGAKGINITADSGDGTPGSEEDRRCDGCAAVQDKGLILLVWVFQPERGKFRCVTSGLLTIIDWRLAEAHEPSQMVTVIGLCRSCFLTTAEHARQMNLAHRRHVASHWN